MKIAKFKSIPRFYEKEILGLKPNTMRKIQFGDERFSSEITHIQIINTKTNESFIRKLTDKSDWDGYMIYSWHPDK